MTHVITIGNFKGGVGKTTTSVMLSYMLQKQHSKTLVIDFDPQANATYIISKTFDVNPEKVPVSFYDGLDNKDLSKSIIKCNDYLDMIPANWDLSQLNFILNHYGKRDQDFVLRYLIDEIKENYDYVIIDTPPTLSDYTNNALIACDYFLIIMQTQEQAYSSSKKFINYALQLHNDYELDNDLLGIVPYLVDRSGSVDNNIISEAKKEYGDVLTKNIIYNRQRVKRYGKDGIKPVHKNWDSWDTDTMDMYSYLLGELEGRIKIDEEAEDDE